jgi:hypothetical protein
MLFKDIIAVYSENHAKPINTKCSITDCQSRWFIYLPLSLKGLITLLLLYRLQDHLIKCRNKPEWQIRKNFEGGDNGLFQATTLASLEH